MHHVPQVRHGAQKRPSKGHPIPLTQITGTADFMSTAPAVVVEHLAGSVSFEEMLRARDGVGQRVCVLDYCELGALMRVLECRGAHDAASDLADVLKHLPADLVGWRRLIATKDPDTGCVVLGAISRSLPALVVDFWIACGALEDGVMVAPPVERVAPEMVVGAWSVYRDSEQISEQVTAREG